MNKLISLAKSLSGLGLHVESDLVRSIYKTSSELGGRAFLNTGAFFRDLAIKLQAIIKNEERKIERFGFSDKKKFEDMQRVCLELREECVSGNLINLPKIFKMNFSQIKDPSYPTDSLLMHSGLGYALGKDIVLLSLTPKEAPVQDGSKNYFEGETEGITESIKEIIANQKKEFDRINKMKKEILSEIESRYLGNLESYKEEMASKLDRKNPNNWGSEYSRHNRRYNEDYDGGMVFVGVSEEQAAKNIEQKTMETEEGIRAEFERVGIPDSDFRPSLTPAQMEWVKLLKIII